MKVNRRLKKRILGAVTAVAIATAFWIGFGIGINEMTDTGSGDAVREAYNNGAEDLQEAQ